MSANVDLVREAFDAFMRGEVDRAHTVAEGKIMRMDAYLTRDQVPDLP
jgi:hypothetical protein